MNWNEQLNQQTETIRGEGAIKSLISSFLSPQPSETPGSKNGNCLGCFTAGCIGLAALVGYGVYTYEQWAPVVAPILERLSNQP